MTKTNAAKQLLRADETVHFIDKKQEESRKRETSLAVVGCGSESHITLRSSLTAFCVSYKPESRFRCTFHVRINPPPMLGGGGGVNTYIYMAHVVGRI